MMISYKIGCRKCLQGDGVKHVIAVPNGDANAYNLVKTEYDVVKQVEAIRKEENKKCSFCGSENVEIMDVQIDDNPLYRLDKMRLKCSTFGYELFALEMDKTYKGTNVRYTDESLSPAIKQKCIRAAINLIETKPPSFFIPHEKGNFFIALTGNEDFFNGEISVRIERFKCVGISKEDIIEILESIQRQWTAA